jgi:Protein kinase domain
MEYVEGHDLAHWLLSDRPWREVVAMFVAAGRGLAAAHAAGITHRDFKPSNVVIGKDGRPRVGDFGLAHDHGAEGTGGTPAYMAPEQATLDTTDPLSDQYAFCASLWEALHGTLPDRSVVTVRDSGRGLVRPAPEVPTTVDAILKRGLAPRTERYASMDALLAALERAIAVRARPPWILAGVTVAAVAAVVIVAATRSSSPERPDPSVGVGALDAARAASSSGDVLRALGRVDVNARATDEARAMAAVAAARGPTLELPQHAPVAAIALSSDGRRLAVATGAELAIYFEGALEHRWATAGDITALAVDDGVTLGLVADGVVELAAENKRTYRVKCPPNDGLQTGVHASLDLRYVVCPSPAGRLVVDRDGPAVELGGLPDVAFDAAAGRMIAVRPQEVEVHDMRARKELARYAIPDGARVVPLGDQIAIANGRELRLEDPITKATRRIVLDFAITDVATIAGRIRSLVAWSDRVLAVYTSDGVQAWHQELARPVTTVFAPPGRSSRFVVVRPHELSIEDLDTGRTMALQTDVARIAVSLDGSVIASAHGSHVTVWYPDLRPPTATQVPALGLVALSPANSAIAYCDDNEAVIRNADTVRLIFPAGCRKVAFGIDGTLGIADGERTVWTWRPNNQPKRLGTATSIAGLHVIDATHVAALDTKYRPIWIADGVTSPCGDVAVDAQARSLVIQTGTSGQTICDLATGKRRELGARAAGWRFSATGERLLRIDGERVTLSRTADLVIEPLPALDRIEKAMLDARGTRVAVVQRGVGIVVLDPRRAAPIVLARSTGPRLFDFSPDGTHVAALVESQVRVWDIERPDQPRDLGTLAARSVLGFDLAVDAVRTVGPGYLVGENWRAGMAIDRWPWSLPTATEVDAWIHRVTPR